MSSGLEDGADFSSEGEEDLVGDDTHGWINFIKGALQFEPPACQLSITTLCSGTDSCVVALREIMNNPALVKHILSVEKDSQRRPQLRRPHAVLR